MNLGSSWPKQIQIKICELFSQGVMKDIAMRSTKKRGNGGWQCQLLAQAGIIIGKIQIRKIKIKVKEEREKSNWFLYSLQ